LHQQCASKDFKDIDYNTYADGIVVWTSNSNFGNYPSIALCTTPGVPYGAEDVKNKVIELLSNNSKVIAGTFGDKYVNLMINLIFYRDTVVDFTHRGFSAGDDVEEWFNINDAARRVDIYLRAYPDGIPEIMEAADKFAEKEFVGISKDDIPAALGLQLADEPPGTTETEATKEATMQDIILEPIAYAGQFVHISSTLVLSDNRPSDKMFRCYLSTGSGKRDYDLDFYLSVYYDEMPDWKTWGSLSADRQKVKVAGTVYVDRDFAYIKASEITIVQ
jgi:hypothetical protein